MNFMLALVAALSLSIPQAQESALTSLPGIAATPTDFIRFTKVKKTSRLETAIVTYENPADGKKITLVGAVHIGDRSYYESLQKELAGYDVVLYEGVSGNPDDELLTMVARIQLLLRDYLGLAHQNDVMKYEGERFHHVDMTAEEILSALDARGVTLVPNAELLKSMGPIVEMALKLLKPSEGEPSPMMLAMQRKLKESMGRVLGEGMAFYDRFKRPDDRARDEVIIGARNARVIEELEKQLQREDVDHVAILYGAAHHADFEKRLEKRWKVRQVKVEWVPAWTVEDPSAKKTEEPKDRGKDL